MKSVKIFLYLSLSLIISSCTTETENCICTQEFRVVIVLVMDESGSPVVGLTSTVSDDKGGLFNFDGEYPLSGYYTVMSDKYVNKFSTLPGRIFFTASSDSTIANGEYLINTDRCKCHIQKISGPDTLIIR